MHPTKRRDLYLCIAAIAFANTVLWIIISQFIGGSASEIRNGHYYLNEHGRRTEVSSTVYRYSQVHAWISIPLALVGAWAGNRGYRLRREMEEYDPVTSRSL